MKHYYKKKRSKITFKTHRKHRAREAMMKKGPSAMSIFSHRYNV